MTPEEIDRLIAASDRVLAARRARHAAITLMEQADSALSDARGAQTRAEAELFSLLKEIRGAADVPV